MSEKIYIYPTDSVWGIGGNIEAIGICKKINLIKKISTPKPLSILFENVVALEEYIELPISLDLLNKLLKFEISIGVDVGVLKKTISKDVYVGSDIIFFRVISNDAIKFIFEKENAPIITTSLNYTSNPAIERTEEAKNFYNEVSETYSDIVLVNQYDLSCSGTSSTMVILKGKSFKILREGIHIQEILEILKQHF